MEEKICAGITAVGHYVPEDVLTNADLEEMVETNDEWIQSRTGIQERRILKDKNKASAFMGAEAAREALNKRGVSAEDVDLIIATTVTPDYMFPATATLIQKYIGAVHAYGFDFNAACSGFLFALTTAANFIEAGNAKKILVVGTDKMSTITDYTDRTTCILFGDAAAAVLVEPVEDGTGVIDYVHHADGDIEGSLIMEGGGSRMPATHESVDQHKHYIKQDGRVVFKKATFGMADVSLDIMRRNELKPDDVSWLVPHQANQRIIDATAKRMGVKNEKVMSNIAKYGNTTTATIPLCLYEWQDQLSYGDNLILAAFGGGFTWGAAYVKWSIKQA